MSTTVMQPIASTASATQQARRGLILYFAILIPLTALLEGIMINAGTLIGLLLLV